VVITRLADLGGAHGYSQPGGVPAGVNVLPGAGVGDARAIVDGVTIGVGLVSLPPQAGVSAATKSSPGGPSSPADPVRST
jgi:hypothetical protein